MSARTRVLSGGIARVGAGVAMAAATMGYMLARDQSVWTNPFIIAVMWMGPEAVSGRFNMATIVGLATHMAASLLMGVIGVPFIADLSRHRTILAAITPSRPIRWRSPS